MKMAMMDMMHCDSIFCCHRREALQKIQVWRSAAARTLKEIEATNLVEEALFYFNKLYDNHGQEEEEEQQHQNQVNVWLGPIILMLKLVIWQHINDIKPTLLLTPPLCP
jgi:uncharacterized membrane protein